MRMIFMDQHGDIERALSLKDLRTRVKGRCTPMYVDGYDGKTYKTGWVIGKRWFSVFIEMRKPV
jgi:hypothetical protein